MYITKKSHSKFTLQAAAVTFDCPRELAHNENREAGTLGCAPLVGLEVVCSFASLDVTGSGRVSGRGGKC